MRHNRRSSRTLVQDVIILLRLSVRLGLVPLTMAAALWACLWPTAGLAAESVIEEAQSKTLPWSGYWWPLRQGKMLGPLGKYDLLTGAKAVDWEKQHHPSGESIPKWYGYCHAWAASSALELEPTKPRQAQREQRQMQLLVGDQKALLAVGHAMDVANSYGDRFGDGRGSEDRLDLAPDALMQIDAETPGAAPQEIAEVRRATWYPSFSRNNRRAGFARRGQDHSARFDDQRRVHMALPAK